MISARWYIQHSRDFTLSIIDPPRLFRFGIAGGVGAFAQLTFLYLLVHQGWQPIPANVTAFILSAQVSFTANSVITWRDRFSIGRLPERWAVYHASIAATAAINMAVFAATHRIVPTLLASALGIGTASIGNFLAGDRLVFRASRRISASQLTASGTSTAECTVMTAE